MASELIVSGYLNRETEFVHGLTGDCGPNAFHTLASWSDNTYISTYTVYQQMRAHSPALCDPNGESTGSGLRTYALTAGYTVAAYYGYAGDVWAGWLKFVLAQLDAGRPVLIELSYGQALKDWLTGKGENATNLHYHYITLVGYNSGVVSTRIEAKGRGVLPNGFWAADGDSFDSGNVLQFITYTSLAAAKPCAALAIARRVPLPAPAPTPSPTTGGSTTMSVPANWKDDGTTLTAPNGHKVIRGFRTLILGQASWPAMLMPLNEESGSATGARQDFGLATTWTASNNAIAEAAPTDFPGQLTQAQSTIAALQAQVSNLNSELTAAKQQLDAAHQQIAALQAQLAAPAALPAEAQAALDYVKSVIVMHDTAAAANTAAQAADDAEAKAIAAVVGA